MDIAALSPNSDRPLIPSDSIGDAVVDVAEAPELHIDPEPQPQPEVQVEAPQLEKEEVPDISVLEGLSVGLNGSIMNAEGVVVGELVQGNARKINKIRSACSSQGEARWISPVGVTV